MEKSNEYICQKVKIEIVAVSRDCFPESLFSGIAEILLAPNILKEPKMFFCSSSRQKRRIIVRWTWRCILCGMLNASYNLRIRGMKAYIPEYPVGNGRMNVQRCYMNLYQSQESCRWIKQLKDHQFWCLVLLNFLACNAPIQQYIQLRELRVEKNFLIMEL